MPALPDQHAAVEVLAVTHLIGACEVHSRFVSEELHHSCMASLRRCVQRSPTPDVERLRVDPLLDQQYTGLEHASSCGPMERRPACAPNALSAAHSKLYSRYTSTAGYTSALHKHSWLHLADPPAEACSGFRAAPSSSRCCHAVRPSLERYARDYPSHIAHQSTQWVAQWQRDLSIEV